MKILITGGQGLLGRHLLKIMENDNEIISLVRKESVVTDNISEIVVDLGSEWSVDVLPDAVDVVIHLAQSSYFRDFPGSALDIFNVNVCTTAKLLDYALNVGAKKIIIASTGGIYTEGRSVFEETDEIVVSRPMGYYLGSKLSSEVLADSYAGLIDTIILRFFFIYGPGQKQHMLIPRLINAIRDGIPISLQGRDGIKINPIYVTEAAKAVNNALDLSGNYKINVAGPGIISLRDVCENIGVLINKSPVFQHREGIEAPILAGDITKMSELLLKPEITLDEGLKSFIE